MRFYKFLCAVFSAALFCACAMPARKAPTIVTVAPAKKEAVINISPGDAKKVEVLYYQAVGAYSNNDMDGARKYINEISTLNPSYPPAAELREKIQSVSRIK